MEWILLLLIGLFSGTVGSLVGFGGGIFIVPLLLFFGNYTSILPSLSPQVIVGTSVFILIITGLSATTAYIKRKKVDYISALLFFAGSGPGAFLGALINQYITLDSFSIYFGFFIVIISFLLTIRDRVKPLKPSRGITRSYQDAAGNQSTYRYNAGFAMMVGLFVGMMSGLFGIGGGSLMVPAMLILFAFPPSVAVGTSMFAVFLQAIVGSATHIYLGNVQWFYALALIPGAWAGGKYGAHLNDRLQDDTVVKILRIALIFAAIRLIWQGFT